MRRLRIPQHLRRIPRPRLRVTGDVLAEEPCCIYQPRGYHPDPIRKILPQSATLMI